MNTITSEWEGRVYKFKIKEYLEIYSAKFNSLDKLI